MLRRYYINPDTTTEDGELATLCDQCSERGELDGEPVELQWAEDLTRRDAAIEDAACYQCNARE